MKWASLTAIFMVCACGAGVPDYDRISREYDARYDYLIGTPFASFKAGVPVSPKKLSSPEGARHSSSSHRATYEYDRSFEYTDFELDPLRATELRANQAVLAGGFVPPGSVGSIVASPSELTRVRKKEACHLRIYVDSAGNIYSIRMIGDLYIVPVARPVPKDCGRRLDALVGYKGG